MSVQCFAGDMVNICKEVADVKLAGKVVNAPLGWTSARCSIAMEMEYVPTEFVSAESDLRVNIAN